MTLFEEKNAFHNIFEIKNKYINYYVGFGAVPAQFFINLLFMIPFVH